MMLSDHQYRKQKKEVAYFMRRLYKKSLTTSLGGNISMKSDNGIVFITPSGIDKGKIKWNQICVLSESGENLTTECKVSIETAMHLAIYKNRPDIKAIVHAHPPVSSTFTALEKEINC